MKPKATEEQMQWYQMGYDTALGEMQFDRARVIEECAQKIEQCRSVIYDATAKAALAEAAAAIRALKDKAP